MSAKALAGFATMFLVSALGSCPRAEAQGFVVMIPGAGSSGAETYIKNLPNFLGSRYFGKYTDELTSAGVDNMVCPRTTDHDQRSIEGREDECVKNILAHEGAAGCSRRNVVLMGHSMGGLVARELAQDPRVDSCIKTVITVSTPNQGTPIADFAIDHAHADDAGFDFYGAIASWVGFTQENLRYLDELRAERSGYPVGTFAAQDLPDNPAVDYFSISTSFQNSWYNPVVIMRGIVADELKKHGLDRTSFGVLNDGVVPEYSQIHGTYLGHLGIIHFESACVDLVRWSPGCQEASDFIIPTLKSQIVLQ